DEMRQITLWQPLCQHRRHQQHLLWVIGAEGLLLSDRGALKHHRLVSLHLHQPPLNCRHAILPVVSRESSQTLRTAPTPARVLTHAPRALAGSLAVGGL